MGTAAATNPMGAVFAVLFAACGGSSTIQAGTAAQACGPADGPALVVVVTPQLLSCGAASPGKRLTIQVDGGAIDRTGHFPVGSGPSTCTVQLCSSDVCQVAGRGAFDVVEVGATTMRVAWSVDFAEHDEGQAQVVVCTAPPPLCG
jgi:hypothetical protein